MEPIAWYDTAGFVAGLLAFFLAVALIAALGWPAGALRRRLRHRGGPVPGICGVPVVSPAWRADS
jgi:hypothetical protein